jgi:hypothetical protein
MSTENTPSLDERISAAERAGNFAEASRLSTAKLLGLQQERDAASLAASDLVNLKPEGQA